MQAEVRQTIERCLEESKAGSLHFAEVVARLSSVGVESYWVDYRTALTRCYLPDGTSCSVPSPQPDEAVAGAFDAAAVRAAIAGAQRDEVRYPEFVKLTRRAGCAGYVVWLAGRHVTYFGRRGEMHVERFPDGPT